MLNSQNTQGESRHPQASATNRYPSTQKRGRNTHRYTPWFYLYNQKEIDEMDEEDRNRLVLWGGSADDGATCGLACAHSFHVWSCSSAAFGSRLAVKSNEIAIYFGEQFKELWKDFLIGKK